MLKLECFEDSSADTSPQLCRDDATGVVIREASLLDAQAIAQAAAHGDGNLQAALSRTGDFVRDAAFQFEVPRIRNALWKTDQLWLVAVRQATLVGFAQLVRAESLELRHLCVTFDSDVAGIGSLLLRGCVRAARETGDRQLWVCVRKDRTRSVEFFYDSGFEPVGCELVWAGGIGADEFAILSRVVEEDIRA